MTPAVSIVIPSRDRLQGLLRVIESIRRTCAPGTPGAVDVEIIAVLDEPDQASRVTIARMQDVRGVIVGAEYLGRPQDKFQRGYEAAQADWIVTATDDVEFTNPGWIEACWQANLGGYVGLYDGIHPSDSYATLVSGSREYIQTVMHGRLGLPWYHIWWADYEWAMRAKQKGAFVVCEAARFKHYHPAIHTAPDDAIYQLAAQWRAADQLTYARRDGLGFPDPDPDYPGM